jgi:membrane-bound metal-dependent hydrolase YbcI (DUF457 family)
MLDDAMILPKLPRRASIPKILSGQVMGVFFLGICGGSLKHCPQIALLPDGEILYHSLCFAYVLMGNFQQHITCSTATGIAVAGIAYHFGFPPSVCLVSAGLCSFAGMLPDIDSDSSKSFQECIYLTAGIACILTAARLRHYVHDSDLALLGGALMFLVIRFGVGTLIKKITTHRGMIHSIPMAILSGELAFFVVTGEVEERLVKAAALTIGYLSHLILDEVYSIDSTGSSLRLKKSFGTALKWSNPKKPREVMALYTVIFCLGFAACSFPEVIEGERDNVQIAEKTPIEKTNSINSWWSQLWGSVKEAAQPVQCEIKREAAEFLAQQGSVQQAQPSSAVQPYSNNVVPKLPESELPAAMQFGTDWSRERLIQPARIMLP